MIRFRSFGAILSASLLLLVGACAGPPPVIPTPSDAPASGSGAASASGSAAAAAPADAQARRIARSMAELAASLPRPRLEYEGAAAEGLALRRVGRTQRVLMIGAHPDDENTAVLAELALGRGADVAYLSLTRGEGGQNLIGGELGEALGLVRSGELLAARRLDGAVQFFTRAYDFGYSRTAEETFRHWPHDSILSDVVEVVRSWRPDVVISVFSGTPRDGHGHHQAAGILAREAYDAAADADRFPEQLGRGLFPHAPARIYQSLWRPEPGEATVTLETGELDPLLGRSRYQVAAASRSRHRSQDMGRAQPMGPNSSALRLIHSRAGGADDGLFAGLDTTLLARALAAGASAPVTDLLRRYEHEAASLREAYSPLTTREPRVRTTREMVALLDSVLPALGASAATAPLAFHVNAERADAADALLRAAGVLLDVVVDRAVVTPGDTIDVRLSLWNGGPSPLPVSALEPVLPYGWWAMTEDPPVGILPPGALATRSFTVHVPLDAAADAPYFLRAPRTGDLYTWPSGGTRRARPFSTPQLLGHAVVFDDVALVARAEHLEIDPAYGERRTAALVLPRVALSVEPDVAVLARGRATDGVAMRVRLVSRAAVPVAGELRFDLPAGWSVTRAGGDGTDAGSTAAGDAGAPSASQTRGGGASPETGLPMRVAPGARTVTVLLHPPPATSADVVRVGVAFVDDAGRRYDTGTQLVDYPHLVPRALPTKPVAIVRPLDVVVPRVRVGYIPGPGDATAEALAALGVAVDTVGDARLRSGDLAAWDVVIAGIRAFEVNPALQNAAVRERLHEWVRSGGVFIAQYNKYEYADEGYAPFPLTMSRPHGRVTDESAEVRILEPQHPILSRPNRIGADAWEGWVQERGLYFADSWDARWTPLLEMADPGREAERGALLAARMGSGWYVYTGLALFRQLPAGVPGAYRLLANLIALGAD